MHIVKPRPHLTDIFDDEVARKISLKFLFILKRIVELRKRHRARLKPTVQHLVDARELLAIDFKSNIINPRAVIILEFDAAQIS